jgi:hypothetical protein
MVNMLIVGSTKRWKQGLAGSCLNKVKEEPYEHPQDDSRTEYLG